MKHLKHINENLSDNEISWDSFIEDLRRDLGSNTNISYKDFCYIENWLFDKILNKTVTGDPKYGKPANYEEIQKLKGVARELRKNK